MNRMFFSNKQKCKYNCMYCFAQWSDYQFQSLYDVNLIKKEEINIIYPSCDGEFFSDENNIKKLNEIIISNDEKIVISISTKGNIDEAILAEVGKMNKILVDSKRGFIKISVTITNSSLVNKLEPFASTYDERINLLSIIEKHGIPSSVIIKPILPFIDINEYRRIIDDASLYTNLFLLGDLYIDKHSSFFKEFINGKYDIKKRKIEWLHQNPVWCVIETSCLMEKLEKYISNKNMFHFDSDSKLIQYIYNEIFTK